LSGEGGVQGGTPGRLRNLMLDFPVTVQDHSRLSASSYGAQKDRSHIVLLKLFLRDYLPSTQNHSPHPSTRGQKEKIKTIWVDPWTDTFVSECRVIDPIEGFNSLEHGTSRNAITKRLDARVLP